MAPDGPPRPEAAPPRPPPTGRAPGAAGRLLVTPHGRPARNALWALIGAVRAGDALAPVTVAVPSTYAGLSLRREGGWRAGGLVNVRFSSLNRIAELLGAPFLATPGRVPLTPARRAGAIRAALEATDGALRDLAAHPATTRAFAATLADLDVLDDDALARVAAANPRAALVVDIARRVRALVADAYTEEDQLHSAAAMVAQRSPALDDLGTVVLFAPRPLTPGAQALVVALARAGSLAAVLAFTGDPGADAPLGVLRDQLAALLGPPEGSAPSTPVTGQRILSCLDADDEVRTVVREVARRLEAGVPLHRMAVAYRNAIPYARLCAELFDAAGIPVHGPRPATLRESVAGRTLLALLSLPAKGFRRDDVAALLATAPVRTRRGGPPAPGPLWDRISCEANVVAGLDQWHDRLTRYRAEREAALARRAAERGTLFASDGSDPRADAAEALRAFVAELATATTPPPGTWRDLADWALGLLDRYLGPAASGPDAWPTTELDAYERVREVVGALAQLDELGAPADPWSFARAVDDGLDVAMGHAGAFGDGVLVAPLAALRGTDADTVFVVGLTEGEFPPPPREDPLLTDAARRMAPELPRRDDTAGRERDDYLAALAAGSERVLTLPRADRRAQRPARPAPWLLETAKALAGRPVLAAELDPDHPLARAAPWLEVVASYEAAIAQAPSVGSRQERNLQSLLAWRTARRPLVRHPLAARRPDLRAGFSAIRARSGRGLGPWEGVVGPRAGLAPGPDHVLSPTSLEAFAWCPFRYFLGRVLGVEEIERPEARERLSAVDRGAIVHDVLQEFFRTHPRSSPDQAWSTGERAALRALAEERFAAAEADGITGRPVWWALERARLQRELATVLDTDEWARRNDGTVPEDFEVGFGAPGDRLPPLTVTADDGTPVAFRGRIDRLDRSPDGSRYVVYDYKTGAGDDLLEITEDPVVRGRRLQLAIYATAVQRAYPDAQIGAHYWFTRRRSDDAFAGFVLDGDVSTRLADVLGTIVSAVRAGQFPAFPGPEAWPAGAEHCRFCPYDRLCPRDRVRRFERRRDDPAFEPVLVLAEQEGPTGPPDHGPDSPELR